MILSGQNVYDSQEWLAVRQLEGTAFHSESTFQYPLPLAILFSAVALIPIQTAYILWMVLVQVALLTSIVILLSFYPSRLGYLELLAIAGIFLFRPTFSIIKNGQILAPLLLALSIAIWLLHKGNWFFAGLILSVFSLKPSVGFPILILAGVWFLSKKQWRAIFGMIAGGLALFVLGALVNPRWVIDYVNVSQNAFYKYYGMHPTIWGIIDKIFEVDKISLPIGFVCVVAIFAVEVNLFWRHRSTLGVFSASATILPAALLIAPYSWNYDQILLTIPIIFLLITISTKYGMGKAVLFMFGVVALAVGLVAIAYWLKHDVWSFLNSFVVWLFSLYFVTKGSQPGNEAKMLS
ncbi:MAG TPA: glycosyltransferase family 87 protein [Anaerolineales bacterium]|nr:glycosyltransferase family 87 protein [Anaerolineales bacterium]